MIFASYAVWRTKTVSYLEYSSVFTMQNFLGKISLSYSVLKLYLVHHIPHFYNSSYSMYSSNTAFIQAVGGNTCSHVHIYKFGQMSKSYKIIYLIIY